jgi:hypothetical protein
MPAGIGDVNALPQQWTSNVLARRGSVVAGQRLDIKWGLRTR